MFERALRFVLKWEGGYSNHPQDPGGATNFGITQRTYDSWRKSKGLPTRDVRDINREEVAQIYREWYWNPLDIEGQNPALQLIAFDSAVNHGVGKAKEFLQSSQGDWRRFAASRILYYTRIRGFDHFGRGWMRRVADCILECTELDAQPRLFVNGQLVGTIEKMTYAGDKLYIKTRG